MKMFLDTSSLFKKFVAESGSDKLESLLKEATVIVVAPTSWLEANSIIRRLAKQKAISNDAAKQLTQEIQKDFEFYEQVIWGQILEAKALEIIQKHQLKTLDSIQLASACLAQADMFVTSDKILYEKAKKELQARFIN